MGAECTGAGTVDEFVTLLMAISMSAAHSARTTGTLVREGMIYKIGATRPRLRGGGGHYPTRGLMRRPPSYRMIRPVLPRLFTVIVVGSRVAHSSIQFKPGRMDGR